MTIYARTDDELRRFEDKKGGEKMLSPTVWRQLPERSSARFETTGQAWINLTKLREIRSSTVSYDSSNLIRQNLATLPFEEKNKLVPLDQPAGPDGRNLEPLPFLRNKLMAREDVEYKMEVVGTVVMAIHYFLLVRNPEK